jgi:hypothetical protein
MLPLYNQKNLSVTVNGYTVQDFMEGAAFTLSYDGGEVQKTKGCDGGSMNLATTQGVTLSFTLRETSRSMDMITSLFLSQYESGIGYTVIVRTGADLIITMANAYIGQAGELQTGDTKMGGRTFTLTSTDTSTENLAMNALNVGVGLANVLRLA